MHRLYDRISTSYRKLIEIRKILIISFFGCTSSFISAQTSYNLSVDELFDRGIQNSLSIKSSIIKTQISADKVNLAKTKQLPDIIVGGNFGYIGQPTILDKDFSFQKHPESPSWKQNYQIIATQPIYQGGYIKNNIEKSNIEKEIADLFLQKNKSDLKLWLIGKYLELFNLYKEQEVYAQNIKEAETRLHDIEKMKEEGMITTNDVLRSQLLLTNYELSNKETKNNIILISQQLDVVLGLDENILLKPDPTLLESQLNIQPEDEYINQAYLQYPDLKIAKANITLSQNNLKLIKADYLPTLSLQVSNTLARPIPYSSPVQDLYINSWGAALNLSFPISSFFKKKHSIHIAKQQIEFQELEEKQQIQTIHTDVKSAYIKHSESIKRIKSLEKSLEQSKENYRIVKNKYYNQLAILTDLLDANAVQLNSELQLTSARTNAIYTYYQLQKVSGNL